ncbi:MAG: FMN-binding negative transcriptional regulator [Gemmatimonadaceae bacterium]
MYTPPAFAETRAGEQYDFLAANPMGVLVTTSPAGLVATHLPFVLDRASGPAGVLRGHVARANPHHSRVGDSTEAMVIFAGPDAYITPSWYPSKQRHGKVVPTWNYVAVHVYGELRATNDPDFLLRHVQALTHQQESEREHSWAVSDAPREYIERLLASIVGLELRITRIEGKWKASQNRSAQDVAGVIEGLSSSGDASDVAMAAVVRERSVQE